MGDLDDIVKDFLVESYENLDQLDRNLVALEKDPTSHDLLASIFRTIHTIKGTCGFLGFAKLEAVAHVGESLLSRMRDGVLLLNPEITSALLAMVDAVRQMLSAIEASGQDGDGDYSALIETLTRLQESGESGNRGIGESETSSTSSAPRATVVALTAAPVRKKKKSAKAKVQSLEPSESQPLISDPQSVDSELHTANFLAPNPQSPIPSPRRGWRCGGQYRTARFASMSGCSTNS